MLKIYLPNKSKHSFSYNIDASIKEVINNFCTKKGLLPDIYEVYDPNALQLYDENESPRHYQMKNLYIRRVNDIQSSTDDCLETETCNGNTEPISQIAYSSTYKIKKPWKFFKGSKSKKSESNSKGKNVNTNTATNKESKNEILLTKIIKKENEPKKRRAPLPPVSTGVTDGKLCDDADLCEHINIPSPPTSSKLANNEVKSFPWFKDLSTFTNTDDDFTYASICGDESPRSVSFSRIIATPVIPNDVYGTFTKSNSISKNGNTNVFDHNNGYEEGDFSDPEEHVYSIIIKNDPTLKQKETEEMHFNVKKTYDNDNTTDKVTAGQSSLPSLIMKSTENSSNFSFNKEDSQKELFNGNTDDHSDSETSSIGTPVFNPPKMNLIEPNTKTDNERQKPTILILKPKNNSSLQQEKHVMLNSECLETETPQKQKPLNSIDEPKNEIQRRPMKIAVKPKEISSESTTELFINKLKKVSTSQNKTFYYTAKTSQ